MIEIPGVTSVPFTTPGSTIPYNAALNFDGIDDVVELNANITDFGASFTLELWIKTTALNGGIITIGDISSSENFNYSKSFYLSEGFPWYKGVNNGSIYADTYVNDGNWHHIAVTFNGTVGKMYIDGVDKKTSNFFYGGYSNVGEIFTLGKSKISWHFEDPRFQGSMRDLRIWNVARTVNQINDNMLIDLNGNETGLKCYNKFNQGTANGDNTSVTTLTNNMLSGGFTGILKNFALSGTTSNWV